MAKFFPKVKAAVVQASPVFLDLENSVKKAVSIIDEAGSHDAKVIAFPESFLPAYPWWIYLGDPTVYGMPFYKEFYKNSFELRSPESQQLADAARRNNMYVCMSATILEGSSLYLAQIWYDPKGNIIGIHKKTRPTNSERTVWGEGDGSTMPVFKTEIGNLGGLLCWENFMPANQLAMAGQDEQIHVASWPAGSMETDHVFSRQACLRTSQQYAEVTGSFVLCSSQPYTAEMREMLSCGDQYKFNFLPLGGAHSAIFDPMGRCLTPSLAHDEEGILYAELDLEQIIEAKYFFDPAGHYSKGSVVGVTLNKKSYKGVHIIGEDADTSIPYESLIEDEV